MVPVAIIGLTVLASLERVPLTGRWRMMLLSPEEEGDIASQLAGAGWYRAVSEILTQAGTPRVLDSSDWRHDWVQHTLRRLEAAIPILQCEAELAPDWMGGGTDGADIPRPPPAAIPLFHRRRTTTRFLRFADAAREEGWFSRDPLAGPPYSLLVADRADAANAFSYGFGGDGGGGIVVFSGLLDEVLAKHSLVVEHPPPAPQSWWMNMFGGIIRPVPQPQARAAPTEEQTSELAILLAHELSHLLLAHHLETLSNGSLVGPGVMSIMTDVVRTLLFPITMLFGPFINDALGEAGKAFSQEFARRSDYCTSQEQEIEADVVSVRLLAHAGFDPRHTVRFWEGRQESSQAAECSHAHAIDASRRAESLSRQWMGEAHPMNVVRVQKLKDELQRWEIARQAARKVRIGEWEEDEDMRGVLV